MWDLLEIKKRNNDECKKRVAERIRNILDAHGICVDNKVEDRLKKFVDTLKYQEERQ